MYKINTYWPKNIALISKKHAIKLIHLSTEYVFDGKKGKGEKYKETDKPNINLKTAPTWYGITKALGEEQILNIYPKGSTIVRFSQIQSPVAGIFFKTLSALLNNQKFNRASDQLIAPITDRTAFEALKLIEQKMHVSNFCGIVHVSATTSNSSFETCLQLAEEFGLRDQSSRSIISQTLAEIVESGEQRILRPYNSILDVSKFKRYFDSKLLAPVVREIKRFHNWYPDTARVV